jgi:nitrite reductase (NADH) small subunit
MSANWKNIGPVANIPLRGARRLCVKSAGKPVAVFRTGEDEIFALVDECPHKQGPLSEGIVSGRTVTCPLHSWVIGLDDGGAVAPDKGSVKPLSVRIVDGDIFVHLPETVGGAV